MITNRKINLTALLFVLILMAACTPTPGQPGIAQGPEVFVFPGPTEKILISTEDIPQNNCDGSAEKSDTVERSHTVLRTLDLGTEITVDTGGQAGIPGIGQVNVGVEVASHYQVGYGTQDTVTRSSKVAAAAGTNILHTIRQYEIWETGEVLISAGGVNQRIPYRFRKDFSMETLPPAKLDCNGQQIQLPTAEVGTEAGQLSEQVGPKEQVPVPTLPPPPRTPEPPPPTHTPQPPRPTDPPSPPPVALSVWAANESGEIFRAERAGIYEVKYLGDAYSPWPSAQVEGYRGWTTILRYYVNRAVEWGTTDFGLQGPINEDGYLTPGNYYLDKNDAIASAGSDKRQIRLNSGEYITFIVLDEKGRYFDNQDKVDVQISFLGE